MYYYNYLVIIILNSIFLYLFSLQYFDHPQTYKLLPVYQPKIKSNVVSECPKIIHQIIPNINYVPSGLYHTILHNINMNPEFEYRIYDYESAFEILTKDFTSDDVKAYMSTNVNQLKSDFINSRNAFINSNNTFINSIFVILSIDLKS
jgi:hypothetical protein